MPMARIPATICVAFTKAKPIQSEAIHFQDCRTDCRPA